MVGLLLVLGLAGCGGGDSSSRSTAASASSGAAGEVVVPLQVVSMAGATLALAPVSINGQGPFRFILDTGAARSAIDSGLASRLNLPQTGQSAQVFGVTSSEQVSLVQLSTWSLGSVSLPATTVGSINFPFPSGNGSQVGGLLGSDQLSRFGSVTIDYQAGQLRFTPRRR